MCMRLFIITTIFFPEWRSLVLLAAKFRTPIFRETYKKKLEKKPDESD